LTKDLLPTSFLQPFVTNQVLQVAGTGDPDGLRHVDAGRAAARAGGRALWS